MSALGDIENAMAARLATATIGGQLAFATAKGVSGGYRPVLREALRRERMPAAYVAFIDEPTAPETKPPVRGAHFIVLVAERVLRQESDPRHGDVGSPGTFALLEAARRRLDDYAPVPGLRLVNLHQKFVDADDRSAVYELLYRVWPVIDEGLRFAGDALAGDDSRMSLEVGPIEFDTGKFRFPGLNGSYERPLGVKPREITWRGRIRAASHAAVNTIEAGIEKAVLAHAVGDVAAAASGRLFRNCLLNCYERQGPRRLDDDEQMVCQDAELLFLQQNPTPGRDD
jgi:hypothetical protein